MAEARTRKRKEKNDIVPEYELNPFCFEEELKIETKTRNLTTRKGTELVSKNGDSTETYFTNVVQKKEVDKEEFIKLFTSQIRVYFDLTKTAYKVFFIVLNLYQKEIGRDEVYLTCKKAQNIAKALDNFELSTPVYYKGLNELIEKKIIAKSTEKYIYFINPAVFFNGDRARFVTEIIKKKEELHKEKMKEAIESTAIKSIEEKVEVVDDVEEIDQLMKKLAAKKAAALKAKEVTDSFSIEDFERVQKEYEEETTPF